MEKSIMRVLAGKVRKGHERYSFGCRRLFGFTAATIARERGCDKSRCFPRAFPWLVMAGLILFASMTILWIEPHLPQQAVRMRASAHSIATAASSEN
jgi:hypothetical protein